MIKVGINGFGRIGRSIFRINEIEKNFDIVAINDIDPLIENHAYLLNYDSLYGSLKNSMVGTPKERESKIADVQKDIQTNEFFARRAA